MIFKLFDSRVSQVGPAYPCGQEQVLISTQVPPFLQGCSHTAMIICT